ncbi:hypothetical protein U1Q18_051703 [Sarracenia purpurea var. burkii]
MKGVIWWISIVSLFAIAVVVGQMRHDGIIVINCSDYPIYANMTYTVLGVEYFRKSAELPKFNKLTVVKYPPELDNCTVNVIFYMQPKGKGDFRERGRVSIPAYRGECFYVTSPMIENPYKLCELERVFMGIRTCPDRWVLDDNYARKTLPAVTESLDPILVTRAPGKTTKDGGPAGKSAPKAALKAPVVGKSKKKG